jgi:hypothetical protein
VKKSVENLVNLGSGDLDWECAMRPLQEDRSGYYNEIDQQPEQRSLGVWYSGAGVADDDVFSRLALKKAHGGTCSNVQFTRVDENGAGGKSGIDSITARFKRDSEPLFQEWSSAADDLERDRYEVRRVSCVEGMLNSTYMATTLPHVVPDFALAVRKASIADAVIDVGECCEFTRAFRSRSCSSHLIIKAKRDCNYLLTDLHLSERNRCDGLSWFVYVRPHLILRMLQDQR